MAKPGLWLFRTSKTARPVRKFIAAPAHRMMIFLHQDARPKDRGSAESSSSPSMAQKPPMGRARRL